MAHHPKQDILATVGQDHVVIFWNCEQGTILHTSELDLDREKTRPTALKFSHNGDYLILGFSDGLLLYLDSKMSKGMQGKGGDSKYSEPSLKMVAK
jgi:WD40 repeat protein